MFLIQAIVSIEMKGRKIMANNIDAQNNEIPQGFTEETWNRRTPEQKQTYLRS